jgi:hypothetical protein
MEVPRTNSPWRSFPLSFAAGVAVVVVLIMMLVLLPIAPLVPTEPNEAESLTKTLKPQ